MDSIKDLINGIGTYLPFFATVAQKPQINVTRIIEALLIAILAGAFSAYITMEKIDLRMDILEKKVDKIYNDVYKPQITGKVPGV